VAKINLDYNYLFPSALQIAADSHRKLSLTTSGGTEKNPYFFSGYFKNPKQTADLLLTLSAISRTRYFSPGELRQRMLAAADPVVTSDGRQLRFEVFSVCCGAYARLDLHESALGGDWLSKGTTNVDFNPPMRAALASVLNSQKVALKVGTDSVELEQGTKSVIERKVKLPIRWLKGFVEVQVYQTTLKPSLELPAIELAKTIRTLPQQNIMQAGNVTFLVPSGRSLRLSQKDAANAIGIGAISRLKTLEPILRYAKTVVIYGNEDRVSALELKLDGASFFFTLSPNAARGFSGEGQALISLVQDSETKTIAKVRSALAWQEKIIPSQIANSLELDTEAVNRALIALGSRGLVGYDLSSNSFFHRELPFDLSLIEELHPRMKKARQIYEEKQVRLAPDNHNQPPNSKAYREAYVQGSSAEHMVQIYPDHEDNSQDSKNSRCTCDWFTKNQGERGPCSHILAVELALQAQEQ
jgi:hypothetical protein